MRLTREERTRLRIKTIRAFDMTAEEGERTRREKHNAKRRTMTRAEYEGNSLSRAKPWEAEGTTAEPGSEGGRRPPQVPGRRKCASIEFPPYQRTIAAPSQAAPPWPAMGSLGFWRSRATGDNEAAMQQGGAS